VVSSGPGAFRTGQSAATLTLRLTLGGGDPAVDFSLLSATDALWRDGAEAENDEVGSTPHQSSGSREQYDALYGQMLVWGRCITSITAR